MSRLYTVTLGLYDKPRFPKRCVVCSGLAPDEKIGVGDFIVSWLGFLTDIPEGWEEVRVPVHSRCKWRFRMRRWIARLTYLVVTGALYYHFGEQIEAFLPISLRRIGLKIVFVILLIPLAYIEVIFPPRFDVTFFSDTVDFEFMDPDYAAKFIERNRDSIRH